MIHMTNQTILTNLTHMTILTIQSNQAISPPRRNSYGTIQHMIREIFNALFYRYRYLSNPPWDCGISPPELMAFIESHPPGRALDLGCGTATNVITLAQHGWQATGVDFVPKAIRSGRAKAARASVQVELILGDVTERSNLHGPYDLVLDMGCYHSLSQEQRRRYRQNLGEVMAPGATYMLYAFTGREDKNRESLIDERDLDGFQEVLSLEKRVDGVDRGRVTSSWFWYVRPVVSRQ